MRSEEEIKKQLQEMMDSEEFSFEEKDWRSASAYLGKKRFQLRAVYLSSILITMLIGTGVYFYSSKEESRSVADDKVVPVNTKQSPLSVQATSPLPTVSNDEKIIQKTVQSSPSA